MSEQTEPLPLSVIAQDHAAIKPTASSSTDTGDHSPPHDNKKPCVPTKNRKLKVKIIVFCLIIVLQI